MSLCLSFQAVFWRHTEAEKLAEREAGDPALALSSGGDMARNQVRSGTLVEAKIVTAISEV